MIYEAFQKMSTEILHNYISYEGDGDSKYSYLGAYGEAESRANIRSALRLRPRPSTYSASIRDCKPSTPGNVSKGFQKLNISKAFSYV
jgi:hypothetical protein